MVNARAEASGNKSPSVRSSSSGNENENEVGKAGGACGANPLPFRPLPAGEAQQEGAAKSQGDTPEAQEQHEEQREDQSCGGGPRCNWWEASGGWQEDSAREFYRYGNQFSDEDELFMCDVCVLLIGFSGNLPGQTIGNAEHAKKCIKEKTCESSNRRMKKANVEHDANQNINSREKHQRCSSRRTRLIRFRWQKTLRCANKPLAQDKVA